MVCKFTTGLRVNLEDEVNGLDLALHGEAMHD
jgi:ammonia channel protein AmtB